MSDPREQYLIRYAGSFAPFVVERAEGSWVFTTDGRKILDFTSGQISSTLGHNHPRVVAAIEHSLRTAIHLNSWMVSDDVLELARRLAELLPDPLERSILLNTGSETNEIAIRMAKIFTGKFEMVGLTRSFHGLLAGTNSLTFSMGHKGSGPLMPGSYAVPAPYCYRCPLGRTVDSCGLACLDLGFDLVDQQSVGSLAGMIVEPVLSTGGVIPLPPGYLAAARAKCDERGMMLIVDEAQTGLGRVGAMFAFEADGVVPDFLTISKTLGGGVPLGATVTSAAIEQACVDAGLLHITTHVSDPMPAAAGLAVLDALVDDDLVTRAARMGEYLTARLLDLADRYEQIGDVRGRGLLIGLELVENRESKLPASALGAAVTDECLRRGLSMNIVKGDGSQTNCFRMAPPLSVTTAEIDLAVSIIDDALSACLDARAAAVPAST
ncbi:MAG TPA: aspartate aminotransferase family protein [Kineosporiaceae bacterium]|nr:aspartate aminotransferase family protein [Kineosporiaceae bacterium]